MNSIHGAIKFTITSNMTGPLPFFLSQSFILTITLNWDRLLRFTVKLRNKNLCLCMKKYVQLLTYLLHFKVFQISETSTAKRKSLSLSIRMCAIELLKSPIQTIVLQKLWETRQISLMKVDFSSKSLNYLTLQKQSSLTRTQSLLTIKL